MSSAFASMCSELSSRASPALLAAGFSKAASEFGRTDIKYEFKRQREGGQDVLEILFNKYRHAHFGVQIYKEPASGLDELITKGGQLLIGSVTSVYRPWPLGVVPFRAYPSGWQRLIGATHINERHAVKAFLDLLPEIEVWWQKQVTSKHIVTSFLIYPGTQSPSDNPPKKKHAGIRARFSDFDKPD